MIINMIGVPLFFGSDRRGVDKGPDDLRIGKIIDILKENKHTVYDLGNLYVEDVDEIAKFSSHKRMKYFDEIIDVNINLAHQVYCSLKANCFPLVIGGDHSLGLGSIAGTSKYHDNLGVIWIDAHGDINTHETTITGNVHGMPLAAAMGYGHEKLTSIYYNGPKVKKENVFIIGARDLDADELKFIEELNLNVWTTEYIKNNGISETLEEVTSKIMQSNIKNIHLSFDIDVLDKSLVPGTGTPVEKGLTVPEVKDILKAIISTNLIKSMDIVELNSALDTESKTLKTALDIVDFCFSYLK